MIAATARRLRQAGPGPQKRLAFNVLERDEEAPLVISDSEYLYEIRVLALGGGSRFALKSRTMSRVVLKPVV